MIATILRLLRPQGIAGLAIALGLGVLLAIQWGEARHWKKQSAGFEQLYQKDQAAFATTVAQYRETAASARAADQANLQRVAAAQSQIDERTANAFEARLAAARARAGQLRLQPAASADPGASPGASMPGLPAAAGGAAQSAGQDRLPAADALTATEQAIQLDELIKWVKAQAAVDPNEKKE